MTKPTPNKRKTNISGVDFARWLRERSAMLPPWQGKAGRASQGGAVMPANTSALLALATRPRRAKLTETEATAVALGIMRATTVPAQAGV